MWILLVVSCYSDYLVQDCCITSGLALSEWPDVKNEVNETLNNIET